MRDSLRVPADADARLQRMVETYALLARTSAAIGPAIDLDTVLETALAGMRRLVDFRGGSIQLLDDRGLYIAAADPPASPEVMASRVPVGQGLGGRILATGEPAYSPDLDADDRVDPELRRLGTNATMRSYLGVPMICLGETIGVMQVDSSEVDAFDVDDLSLLEGLAAQAAGAIESARRFEQVMELERLKSDFIARVSHELRTPITIMDGFLTTVLTHEDTLEVDQRRHMLERSQAAVSRLAGLIEDLITLSRLETGVVIAHPHEVLLPPLLDDVCNASIDPEHVTVSCPADLTAVTDPSLLERALGFVVDNALKYGGAAAIDAVSPPLRITVTDPGPGVPEDVRSTIFELFTRSEGTTTVPGLGLGLPMARTLLGVLGADIVIDSPPKGGTAVRITFQT